MQRIRVRWVAVPALVVLLFACREPSDLSVGIDYGPGVSRSLAEHRARTISDLTYSAIDDVRGGVLGLYQSSLSLSTIISTAIGGLLFAIAATLPYWTAALLAAIALIPSIVLFLRFGRKEQPSETTQSAS